MMQIITGLFPAPMLQVMFIGYLLGSIPTAYWLGRFVYRINIFDHGSRSMGATNIHRVLGAVPFAVTLTLDIFKGVLAVIIAGSFVTYPEQVVILKIFGGMSAIAGHTLSFWVRFRGGKGVATGLGVFLALTPVSSICSLILFMAVLLVSHYVSLSSIIAAASLPIFIFLWNEGGPEWNGLITLIASVVACYIVLRHQANIGRLIRGEESPLKTGEEINEIK